MNKKQRKELDEILNKLEELRDSLQMMGDEEAEKFENLPESLQSSAKGDELDENSSSLCDAASDLDDIINGLRETFEL